MTEARSGNNGAVCVCFIPNNDLGLTYYGLSDKTSKQLVVREDYKKAAPQTITGRSSSICGSTALLSFKRHQITLRVAITDTPPPPDIMQHIMMPYQNRDINF